MKAFILFVLLLAAKTGLSQSLCNPINLLVEFKVHKVLIFSNMDSAGVEVERLRIIYTYDSLGRISAIERPNPFKHKYSINYYYYRGNTTDGIKVIETNLDGSLFEERVAP